MKKVVIFGGSSFAKQAYVYLSHDKHFEVAAFTINKDYIQENVFMGLEMVPFEEIEQRYPADEFAIYVAIGYRKLNKIREKAYLRVKEKGYELISYVSSKTANWGHFEIGENTFMYGNGAIMPFASIGNNVIIGSALIGENSKIEDHCFISSQSIISGKVSIGKYSFVGNNATISTGVKVARGCVIGAGAIILEDTEAGGVYPGIKSKKIQLTAMDLKFFK